MTQILQARMALWMQSFLLVAVVILGVSTVGCLVEIPGWEKLIGVLVFIGWCISVEAVIGFGKVFINDQYLGASCLLGEYRIQWDEVENLWNDSSGLNWVFEGNGKRVAVPVPSLWRSSDKEAMIDILNHELDSREIKPKINGFKTMLLSNRAARRKQK